MKTPFTIEDLILDNDRRYQLIYNESLIEQVTLKLIEVEQYYESETGVKVSAIAAGGFLRDLVCQVVPKDLDIYLLPIGSEPEGHSINREALSVEEKLAIFNTKTGYEFSNGLTFVTKLEKKFDIEVYSKVIPIDILKGNPKQYTCAEDILMTFDTDIIQIAMDTDGEFYTTPNTPPIDQYFRREFRVTASTFNKNRLDRLNKKGWSLIEEPI